MRDMGRFRNRVRGRGRGGHHDGGHIDGRGGGVHRTDMNAGGGGRGASRFHHEMRGSGSVRISSRVIRRGIRSRGGGRGRGMESNRGGGFSGGDISRGDTRGGFFSRGGRPRNGGRNRNSKKWGRLVATIEKQVHAEVRKCVECRKDNPPYRCPKCYKNYCSVWCCKTHVAGAKCIPIGELLKSSIELNNQICGNRRKSSIPKQYLYPSKDTVKPETLAGLNQPPCRDTMSVMFKSKNLRQKIEAIDNSTDSVKLFDAFMKDKEFSQFSTFVLEALSDQFVDDVSSNMEKLQVQKSV